MHCHGKCKLLSVAEQQNAPPSFDFRKMNQDFFWISLSGEGFTSLAKTEKKHTFGYASSLGQKRIQKRLRPPCHLLF